MSMAAASLTSSAASMASSASIFTRSSSPTMARASGEIIACISVRPPASTIASRRLAAQWCSMTRIAAALPAGIESASSCIRSTERPASRSATASAPTSAPSTMPAAPPAWSPMSPPAIAPRRIRSVSDRSVKCIEFSMSPCWSFWTKMTSTRRITPRFRARRSSAMIRPVASNLSNPTTKTWIGPVTCLSVMSLCLLRPCFPMSGVGRTPNGSCARRT